MKRIVEIIIGLILIFSPFLYLMIKISLSNPGFIFDIIIAFGIALLWGFVCLKGVDLIIGKK